MNEAEIALRFYRHIKRHNEVMFSDGLAHCKICGMTETEIAEDVNSVPTHMTQKNWNKRCLKCLYYENDNPICEECVDGNKFVMYVNLRCKR